MLDEAIDYLKSLQLQLQVLNASYHMHKLVDSAQHASFLFFSSASFAVIASQPADLLQIALIIWTYKLCNASSLLYLNTQMLVMGKGMAPVVPPELQQYMHYITADPAQMPPLRPSGQQPRPFQITQANSHRQSNVESDFLSQMQNLHPSEPPQNFLRPPKLQLYTPVGGSNLWLSLLIWACLSGL